MRPIDADKLIDDYNASEGTISDLMELILDADEIAANFVHAHVVANWLGDCHCSNCGENIDSTSNFCNHCGARLDEPDGKED